MKNLCLLEADLEAEQPRGICKAGRNALKSSLRVGKRVLQATLGIFKVKCSARRLAQPCHGLASWDGE